MPMGNDLLTAKMSITVAKAWCAARPDCCGFTFAATSVPTDETERFQVVFKSSPAWAPGEGWQTFLAEHQPALPDEVPDPDAGIELDVLNVSGEAAPEPEEPEEFQEEEEVLTPEEQFERWIAAMTPEQLRIHHLRKKKLEDMMTNNKQKSSWFGKKYKSDDAETLLHDFQGKELGLFEEVEKKFGIEKDHDQRFDEVYLSCLSVTDIKAMLNGYEVPPGQQVGLGKLGLVALLRQVQEAKHHLLKGKRVLIQGLRSKPELNGEQAVANDFDEAKGRYSVTIESNDIDRHGLIMALKTDNLRLAPSQEPPSKEPSVDDEQAPEGESAEPEEPAEPEDTLASLSVREMKALLNGYGVDPRQQVGLEKQELLDLLRKTKEEANKPQQKPAAPPDAPPAPVAEKEGATLQEQYSEHFPTVQKS